MRANVKKTIIVYILKILYTYTSYDYPATQTAIVTYLNDIGIECSRKTVGRNLRYLIEIGLPIKRRNTKNGGYYYDIEHDNFFIRSKLYEKSEERK